MHSLWPLDRTVHALIMWAMRVFRRPLGICLAMLFVVSAVTMLIANDDPFVRVWLCTNITCPDISHLKAWRKIAYDLSVGSVVSLFFYWLVVRVPEHQRRNRIKRSFGARYLQFKEDCIAVMLGVADSGYDAELPSRLVDQKQFREYFMAPVSSSQCRWDAFLNQLDQPNLRELTKVLEIFRAEVTYVLGSVDISDEEPFEFLKRLSATILCMQDTTLGYDDTKLFARNLWEVFAGWSFVTGALRKDIIKEMIDAI
jgi:hypothetical protein